MNEIVAIRLPSQFITVNHYVSQCVVGGGVSECARALANNLRTVPLCVLPLCLCILLCLCVSECGRGRGARAHISCVVADEERVCVCAVSYTHLTLPTIVGV